ncbi:PdaC/SigV domain-containing protein [Hephaestia sp. GCM10023244]|uniref:PdaC/SigV domain-containing protein n=1 Tax=unclassified Hephaestia TaxID=2631281 RepID=UPI0020771FD5|nr:DUF4163 domain-containing protein [Hephaestia sp. MAHUQ-44]MCM8731733.1 DUF4163 domain-containing protein [Hephaestia sp. MAHUQ-44]
MDTRLPLALAAAVMLIAGCTSQPTADSAAANASGEAPDNAVAAAPAEPIHLVDKTTAIDFDYKIPADAAAIPALRAHLLADAKTAKEAMLRDHAQYVTLLPPDAPARPYGLQKDWSVAGGTAQLLSLVAHSYVYTGGAHGNNLFEGLVWDKHANRAVPFDALFTDKAKALAAIRTPFCDALNKERATRRGGSVGTADDWSTQCPAFDDQITLAFASPASDTFSRIAVSIPSIVAGPHSEGNYLFDIAIPREMIAVIAPQWRGSFAD